MGSVYFHDAWPRPDSELLKRFSNVPTADILDAAGRFLPFFSPTLRLLCGKPAFVGTAITVRCAPSDNLAVLASFSLIRPGDVLVVATGQADGPAVVGDTTAGKVKDAGGLAIITDGWARDIDGMVATGLPVYARGLNPAGPIKQGPGSVGLPVAVNGVSICSGDVVIGDDDGLAVIPAAFAKFLASKLAEPAKPALAYDAPGFASALVRLET